ncbi:MAG TPA: bestrophin family ion channel [Polyangiaceae bacterium]|nr:bestrophin family ion channel [Polyangiaceae bacterium]
MSDVLTPPPRFWRYAFAYRGSATPQVLPGVLVFSGLAAVVVLLHERFPVVEVAVGPIEVSGAALALLLVLRTNAGYERWWEGRKLWGGIVNQSRNVVIGALAYGPVEQSWREQVVRWSAAFPHVVRRSLRGQRDLPEVCELLGQPTTREIAGAQHMPSFVASRVAALLRRGRTRSPEDGLDGFAFENVDEQRALLVDHVGACERILKTPLAFAYAVMIRRFIVIYLALVPFGLVDTVGWATPFVTMFVSYPILALDYIGTELQNPFSESSLSHLPLDEICASLQANLLAMLDVERGQTSHD